MSKVFLTVINMSISASWIVLAVLLLRFVLKKAPKWSRVLLWGIVAVRLVCPFSIESVLSLMPSAETVSPEIMLDDTPHINSGIPFVNNALNPIISDSFAPAPEASANPLQIIVPILAVIWLVGIAVMLIYTLISYLRVKRKVRTAVLMRDDIYQCEAVASPFVLGVIRPKIYMPFNMSEQDASHVIAHERAHIKRKDHLWKPFGFLLLTLHWFNPLMWLGYVLLCRDIELACDEKVIKELDHEQKADYSQALLSCSVNRRMIAACPLAFGEVGVKERVKSVLSYKKPAFWIMIVAVAALIVTSVCLLTDPKPREIGDLDDDLQVFLDMKVAEHNSHKDINNNFIAVSYDVMRIEERSSETSVYAWILYMEYSCENGVLKEECGSHTPTVITAKKSGDGYELVEYWQPRDGSYYAKDIKDKFPRSLWSQALDSQRTIEKQNAECLKNASDYFGLSGTNIGGNFGNMIYGDLADAKSLKTKYPMYFNLDISNGLEVYVWQLASDSYSCGLVSAKKPPADILNLSPTSLEEMRIIVASYYPFISKSNVAVKPIQMPYSSYIYDITPEYTEKLTALFWSGFPVIDITTPIHDQIVFDVDNDGKDENCFLGYGWTSGRFSFRFSISENGNVEYYDTFYSRWYDLSFKVINDGLFVQGITQGETPETHLFEISFDDGHVILKRYGDEPSEWDPFTDKQLWD